MSTSNRFFTAADVAELTGTSKSTAYTLIRKMNNELEDAGYLVIRGKVPVSYALERLHLSVPGKGVEE